MSPCASSKLVLPMRFCTGQSSTVRFTKLLLVLRRRRATSKSFVNRTMLDWPMQKRIGNTRLELAQGDITTLAVDAIVNAANKHLAHGGGVAAAISHKGGPAIQQESDAIIAQRGPLETGEAVATSGGKLPAKF